MSLQRVIFDVLTQVTDGGAYLNLALKDALSGLGDNERKTVTASVHYCLENIRYIDYLIANYAKGRLNGRVRNVLRLGFTRALFMRVPKHAVCSDAVNLVREIGKSALSGYVNGVMRAVCRDAEGNTLPALSENPELALGIEFSYPDFAVREYIDRFGVERARSIMALKQLGVSIRPQYPYTADELQSELESSGIRFRRGKYVRDVFHIEGGFDPSRSELFAKGLITVQSESSALVCRAANAKPGLRVLDTCAAPGGKTALMAAMMQNTGEITAWDTHPHRVELIEQTMKRLNVDIVKASVHDAREHIAEYDGAFDIVLTDVPCSGLGVVNKPDIRLRATDEGVRELSVLQSEILNAASRYVKPGGTLVYSTCTVSLRENENVVSAFLENNPFSPGMLEGFPRELIDRSERGMLTLTPDLDDTEGFFIAQMVRDR